MMGHTKTAAPSQINPRSRVRKYLRTRMTAMARYKTKAEIASTRRSMP